jgi:hypothetical protein
MGIGTVGERVRLLRLTKGIGSVALLSRLSPIAVFVLSVLLSNVAVGALRLVFEGQYYDRSLASRPGDDVLGVYLALASYTIRRKDYIIGGSGLPGLAANRLWHYSVAFASLLVGIGLESVSVYFSTSGETLANMYHNLITVPIMGYFVVSVMPVFSEKRVRREGILATICLCCWISLLIYDIKEGNLQKNTPHGFALTFAQPHQCQDRLIESVCRANGSA